ncbi:MAG TPA: hypothetical protein VJT80_07160 [Steroidobacteraceae bacterium]|nr:hypothetical protein [Steroidobacteraceae bacterium]
MAAHQSEPEENRVGNTEIDSQLFAIRRSARYHDRRTTHYDRLHRATNLVTVMLAGVVLMDLLGAEIPTPVKIVAAIGALLGACDLVVSFSRTANLHRNLKRKFVVLERQIIENEMDVRQLQARRLEIESEEPAIFRALDVLCHIETCAALGKEVSVHLPWYMRVTSQWLHWSDAGLAAQESFERRLAKQLRKRRDS